MENVHWQQRNGDTSMVEQDTVIKSDELQPQRYSEISTNDPQDGDLEQKWKIAKEYVWFSVYIKLKRGTTMDLEIYI